MSPARIFDDLRRRPNRHTPPPGSRSGVALLTGGISFVALILSALKEAWGADPDLALFERGDITYKDFAHGSFELVTKEAVPRHFIVDDPGQTVVLERHGSSVGLTQVANSASRMEDLQSQQQDVLANYAKEHGPPGSSTPPGEADPSRQPINLIEPDGPTLQHALPSLVIPASFIPDAPPPKLMLGAGVVEVDTFRFDEFSASSGSFSATSFGSGAAPTFGIAGGIGGPFTIAGASFDVEKPGSFGVLYVNSHTGAYTYVPNDHAINALKAPSTDNFTITASDGFASASQTFSIDINGTDDASVISGATAGSVAAVATTFAAAFAASHDAHAMPTASGMLTDTDVDDPANTFTAVSTPHASDHGYGTFTMTTDGHWTYALDDANPAVLALNARDTATDTFTVTTIGGTPQTITVTIQGANDAAIISGTSSGSVVEAGGVANALAGTATASGTLTDTDVDNAPNSFTAAAAGSATDHGYGTYEMTAAGTWTYTPDNSNATVQGLNVGDSTTDTFTVTTIDGTAQVITVTINGTNDAAIISGTSSGCVVEAGGVANALAGTPTASGTLTDTDIDNAANSFTAAAAGSATDHGYGTFEMTAAGTWTYTLDNSNATVQGLNVGDSTTDTFTVTTIDGTPQTITVTIQGADDPSVVSGDTHGHVIEAGGVHNSDHGVPLAVGVLTAVDVDGPADDFVAAPCPERSDQGYGSFTMTADGHWTYALDNGNCVVQALNVGDCLLDSFTVKTADGTAQLVTVTIEGSNDAATICGDLCGRVTEPSNPCTPPPSACGILTDKDVDNPNDTFTATACPQASEHGYGSFTMTAGGVWTYTLDPANAAVEALRSCDTLIDCFTVTTVDGTPQVVTVAIQGADHPQDQSFHFKEDAASPALASAVAAPPDPPLVAQAEPPAPHPIEPGSDVWLLTGYDDGTVHAGLPVPALHHDLIV